MPISYHSHHSPIGANASFTVGKFFGGGGFAIDTGKPAKEDVYVGIRRGNGPAVSLPFFKSTDAANLDIFLVEGAAEQPNDGVQILAFPEEQISRQLGWGTDTWTAPGVTFRLITAFDSIPDPTIAPANDVKLAFVPAIIAEVTFDNSTSTETATGFFSIGGASKSLRTVDDATGGAGLTGVAFQREWGMAASPASGALSFVHFSLIDVLGQTEPEIFRLGATGGLLLNLVAGEVKKLTVALGFYEGDYATTGIDTHYFYTRYFTSLEEVLNYALENAPKLIANAEQRDAELKATKLNDDQKFMIAQATRSYYGNTELLDNGGKPLWVVNEGEYQMMNTFDLTVDMLFYELRFNPWTVRNVLDQFAERYSYYDKVKHPDEPGVWYPGGIAFTHDMGSLNQFTRAEHSSYERTGLEGCFSHMTHEQLNNWVLCAALYVNKTDDEHWLVRRRCILKECFQSLLNRDGRTPEEYDGVMNLDSSRCGVNGQEITTYDSIDASLGQSRNNLHVAVKTWAAYLALKAMFTRLDLLADAQLCEEAAQRTSATVVSKYLPEEGFIPAVFENDNRSAIIPAIEGLVFPYLLGDLDSVAIDGRFADLIQTLVKHLQTVLVPGVCIDAKGHWWKMSSASNNTWFSKVAISQFIARQILGFDFGAEGLVHDRAHADWQRIGSTEWAMCDQIVNGIGLGSRYYPRGVSDILWLEESVETAVLTPKK